MKYMKLFACLLAGALVLTACGDDDEPTVEYGNVTVTSGLFILNEGNYFSQVNGSLDYLDYSTSSVSRGVFLKANGRALGGTPNNAVICGAKMYIATQDENRVEVVDLNTLKTYSPIDVIAPRELCTDGKSVYVSSYTGEVSKLDTASLTVVQKSPVVGANLEGIAYRKGYVYVCNAWNNDYTYNTNVVKLNAETLAKVKDITVMTNPNQLIASGDDLYLASWGNYFDVSPFVQHISLDDQVKTMVHGVHIALGDKKLYVIDTSYDANYNEVNSYYVYDFSTNEYGEFIQGTEIDSPCTIAVDPQTGDVFISSRKKYLDSNGLLAVSYTQDGYVARYKADGTFKGKYECGVNPGTLLFVSHTEKRPLGE